MQQCKHEVYRDKKSYNYNVLAKSVTTKLSCQKKENKKSKMGKKHFVHSLLESAELISAHISPHTAGKCSFCERKHGEK